MTRVSHANSHRGVHQPATLDRPRPVHKQKKPYKIILEAVTQEKRKLQSILTYEDNAPTGFGFVRLGYPDFTEWCKEQCRQRNLDVHIVSAKPKNKAHHDPEKISHHVHRIGHHFPNEIIELGCTKFGYDYDRHTGSLKKNNRGGEDFIARHIAEYTQRKRLHGRPVAETETKDHIRGAVRELFPKIPDADLAAIVNHAFEEGTNRVGNAKELPLARRVQLAVVAHIRHTYTEYDNILRTGSWAEARSRVEHVSLAKLKEWRDEAGDESHELEETFREVIVLDDEDEESADGDTPSDGDGRESSMEIVSHRATARELQPEYVDMPRGDFHYASRPSRRTIIVPAVPAPYRYPVNAAPPIAYPVAQTLRAPSRAPQPVAAVELALKFRPEAFRLVHSRPMDPRMRSTVFEPVAREAYPMQGRGSDGRMYNLEPIEEPQGHARPSRDYGPRSGDFDPVAPHVREGYMQPPRRVNSLEGNRTSRPTLAPSRRTSEQDIVLPSVEREADGVSSPRRAPDAPPQFRHDRNSGSISYAEVQSPKRKDFPVSMYHAEEGNHPQAAKRLKPIYDASDAYMRLAPSQPDIPRQIRDREPMDSYGRHRVQPYVETINLTSSPTRPLYGGGREVFAPAPPRMMAGPSNPSYVLAPPRGDARTVYYHVPVRESSRAYIPELDRGYERRALPPRDYAVPVREERRPVELEEDGRYLRSGFNYGGYELH